MKISSDLFRKNIPLPCSHMEWALSRFQAGGKLKAQDHAKSWLVWGQSAFIGPMSLFFFLFLCLLWAGVQDCILQECFWTAGI
jgi:hypothetical protein